MCLFVWITFFKQQKLKLKKIGLTFVVVVVVVCYLGAGDEGFR